MCVCVRQFMRVPDKATEILILLFPVSHFSLCAHFLLPLEPPDWLLLQERRKARKIYLQRPRLFNWRGVVIGCWTFASYQYEASLSSCTTVAPKTAGEGRVRDNHMCYSYNIHSRRSTPTMVLVVQPLAAAKSLVATPPVTHVKNKEAMYSELVLIWPS